MGTLVNPVGWRVKYNRHWGVNFYLSDLRFFLQNNNQTVCLIIIMKILRRLNKKNFFFGFLKFLVPSIVIDKNETVVFLRLRFFRDYFLRLKAGRKYKYLRPEIFKANRLQMRNRL